jgi:Tol biopolymer transport system component
VAFPVVSPNGQLIAFVSDVHDLGAERNVYTASSAAGTRLRRIITTGDDLAPRFAPTTRRRCQQ